MNNTRTSTSTTEAATAGALKSAYDTVNNALNTHKGDTSVHLNATDRAILTKANKFKGYYETETALNNANPTGTAGDYAIVNTTDTVWIWDADKEGGAGWKDGAGKGSVISVNNMTGEVVLTKVNIGLGNVDNTSDANKPISTAQQAALNNKVSKSGDTMTGALTVNSTITTSNFVNIGTTAANAKLKLNGREAMRGVDGWLRINNGTDSGEFASGIYCGSGILRTDGTFQVGSGGSKFSVNNNGAVLSALAITAGTDLKTKSGVVNFNDKLNVQYNSIEECIEFIFN